MELSVFYPILRSYSKLYTDRVPGKKLMTFLPHIWHRNQHKSFSLIDKYCKYLIPRIDLLYFSSNIMKSSVFFQALGPCTTLKILRAMKTLFTTCLFVSDTFTCAPLLQKLLIITNLCWWLSL